MLKLKSTIVASTEAHSVNELLIDSLEHETNSHVMAMESMFHKIDAFNKTGELLNNIPVLSMEAAALVDLVSHIVSQGTDLNGSSDLIPGLEAAVIDAVPTENKGAGFKGVAGKISGGIAAMFKKFMDMLRRGFNFLNDSAKETTTKLISLGDELKESKLSKIAFAAPQHRIDAILNKNRAGITKFITDYKVPNLPTSGTEIDASTKDKVKDYILNTTRILRDATKDSTDSEFETMLDLPTAKVYHYALPTPSDENLSKFRVKAEVRDEKADVSAFSAIGQLETDFLKPTKEWLDEISGHGDTYVKASEDLEKLGIGITSSTGSSAVFEILKMHRFVGITVPAAIVAMVSGAVKDIEAAMKATA